MWIHPSNSGLQLDTAVEFLIIHAKSRNAASNVVRPKNCPIQTFRYDSFSIFPIFSILIFSELEQP